MRRVAKFLPSVVILAGGILVARPEAVQAQAPVITTFAPAPTVTFMPVRRGLFGLRQGWVPVVSQPSVVPVTTFAAPVVVASPISVAQPVVVSRPVIVSRPVVVASSPVLVGPSFAVPGPVVAGRPVIASSPVVVSPPVVVGAPVTTFFAPAPANTVFMPAW